MQNLDREQNKIQDKTEARQSISKVRPMAKDRISQLYERGRVFPDGKNSENHPHPRSTPKQGHDGLGRHREDHRPQHPENWQDSGTDGNRYRNDVDKKSWLQSGTATDKPFFDKGQDGHQAWRAGRAKSDNWQTASESDRRDPCLT